MFMERPPRRAVFCETGIDQNMGRGGKSMTWYEGTKTLTSGLVRQGPVSSPVCDSRNPLQHRLETLGDMAHYPSR